MDRNEPVKNLKDNIRYFIPTYRRAGKVKTIETLKELGVQAKNITLSTQGEKADYQRAYPGVGIIDGEAHNAAGNRNNILAASTGEDIIMLDDDISRISVAEGGKLRSITAEEWGKVVTELFSEPKIAAWGVYPVADAYYMSQTVSTRAIVTGTIMGIRNDYGIRFNEGLAIKEDYEYCLHARVKGLQVLRLNAICAEADHRTAGGCYDDWAKDKECTTAIKMRYRKMLKETKDETKILVKGGSKREWKW